MKIKLLSSYSRCATFELCTETCYFAPQPFSVRCNGKDAGTFSSNIFTLHGLCPATQYTITACDSEIAFVTPSEKKLVDVRSVGAVADGKTDTTAALQSAIDCCEGGGTVLVPPGVYYTYPLFLKSGVSMYLEKGATLLAGTQREKYPVLPGMQFNDDMTQEVNYGTWEGNPLDCFASLITAVRQCNVAVLGEGTLDGNAQNSDWWENPKKRNLAWRPRTIFTNGCNHVDIVGVTVQNSPSWTVHPYYSDNVKVLDIKIHNPDNSPNTDGVDPESCENVLIAGALISVGDDCIALKSGKMYMAQYHHKATKNCIIRNCLLERGHGAIVIGSEAASGVDGVYVSQCAMRNTDRGLRIKTRRGRGERCLLTNIEFCNITMDHVLTPFVINMFYCCDPDGRSDYVASNTPLPVTQHTPCVGTLTCRQIRATNCSVAGAYLSGLPERPIEAVAMESVSISFSEEAQLGVPAMMRDIAPMKKIGFFAQNVKRLSLHDVKIENAQGEPMHLFQVEELVEDMYEQA